LRAQGSARFACRVDPFQRVGHDRGGQPTSARVVTGEPHHNPLSATETTISVEAVHGTGTRATWNAAMSPAAFTTARPTLPPTGYRPAAAGDRDMRGLE
jgi:hypothetical protein